MSLVLSTGLVNYLAGYGCLRAAFEDSLLNIYGGVTPPLTADEAPTGTLLVTVTRASATTYISSAYEGWGEQNTVEITSHAGGETWYFDVTIDSETLITTRTYTNTPDAGDVYDVAVRVAKLFRDVGLKAAAKGVTDGLIYVWAPAKKSLLIAKHGTGTCTVTDNTYAVQVNNDLLHFGPPTAGAISKDSDVWSGLNGATGVASYYRLIRPSDTGILSQTDIRVQGMIATSGADLNMSNTTLTVGATTTIDAFSLTLPKSNG